MLSQEDVKSLFEDFLNEQGEWQAFKDFITEKGYVLEELGFEDDE